MRKPVQQLLGIAAPRRMRPSSLEDRGYGTTESPGQRAIRLSRERQSHEARKRSEHEARADIPAIRREILGKMP